MANFYEVPCDATRYNADVMTLIGLKNLSNRALFLYGEIADIGTLIESGGVPDICCLTATDITRIIYHLNMDDYRAEQEFRKENPEKEFRRKPILLFIDSPGGDSGEGFALVDMIKLSKTPVWTINLGEWSSMGFLIGITGHRRLSLPSSTFLWHDGSTGYFGSSGKVEDTADFNKLYKNTVMKSHVIENARQKLVDEDHPKLFTEKFYDEHNREEFYMLPERALEFGFIDEIITDLSILFTS